MLLNEENHYEMVVGAKIVASTPNGTASVALTLADGRVLTLTLEGDCCSSSTYTDASQFDELIGSTIQSIEERAGETENNGELQWHFLVFTTNKGHVTIDWRNDSNGYYDGSVVTRLDAAPMVAP